MTYSHTLYYNNSLMGVSITLDVGGLPCPLPVLKTKVCMQQIKIGDVIKIHISDESAKTELCLFAEASGHQLLDCQPSDSGWILWLQK